MAPAVADVYSIGVVAVATGGENVHASYLAVSNSGSASTYQGIALSTTGNADGTFFAASGTGCARAPWFVVAVSGTGCAEAPVAVSGTGPVGYNNPATGGNGGLVSVSGTNCAKASHIAIGGGCADGGTGVAGTGAAKGGLIAVSGTGDATSTYTGFGVSGAGNASGERVAVSGTGPATSTSSGVAVSGTGRAYGTGTNVSGEAYVLGTGLLSAPVTPEQALVPTTDPGDPTHLPMKLAEMAQLAPYVALNMATGLTEGTSAPTSAPTTASSSSYNPPKAMTVGMGMIAQDRWYYCVPASIAMYLSAHGSNPYSQNDWAARLGTTHPQANNDPKAGTPLQNTVSYINRHKGHSDSVFWVDVHDAKDLMDRVTSDVYQWRHSSLLGAVPAAGMENWSGKGTRPHAFVAHGYDHRSGGKIYIMDPYDYTRFNWNQQSWNGPNPGGSHLLSLGRLWSAVKEQSGGWMVW